MEQKTESDSLDDIIVEYEEIPEEPKPKKVATSSIPKVDEFDPTVIPFQHCALLDIRVNFDYTNGTQVVLFSGAVGSAKSVMAAHLIWTHALMNANADIGIGRKDLKRLKQTLLKTILLHAPSNWKLGVDFFYNDSKHKITLPNGSTITCFSWADGDMERFKSEQFSMFVMEEASESEKEVFDAVIQRLGRLTHIDEKLFLLLTNPDEPEHWINKSIIEKCGNIDGKRRIGDEGMYDYNMHTYYSLTVQNPYIPAAYVKTLLQKYNAAQVQRYLEGKWISFGGEGIYFAYDEAIHYKPTDYTIDLRYPIHICCDFNISQGKPHSWAMLQYIGDVFHIFDELVVEGAATSVMLDEAYNKGWFSHTAKYIINGDAAGRSRGSANGYSDYQIIEAFLRNLKLKGQLDYKIMVPASNPDLKVRHNTVNAYLKNGLNQVRLYVYKKAPTVNEALKLTRLKEGSKYIENDSKSCPYQHIGSAIGYSICTSQTTASGGNTVIKF